MPATPTHATVRMFEMALAIADDAARSDIESFCTPVADPEHSASPTDEIRHAWYDITDRTPIDLETAAIVSTAIEYLRLRGKLIFHPEHDHLVRPA